MRTNKKMIFWAVDCQKDFMNPDGALYVEGAESIKPNLKKLTGFAKKYNIMVVNTRDWHVLSDEELSDNPDFVNTFPNHCLYGSKGAEFIEETNPLISESSEISAIESSPEIALLDRNIIINKNKFDVFTGNPHTNKFLDFINPDMAIVYGVATNVCVNCAVLGLLKKGIRVLVIEDAIKGLPNLPEEEVLLDWVDEGVWLYNMAELENYLELQHEMGNLKV